MPNNLELLSLQTSLGQNTDEVFGPALQAPSLTRTRHTFDPL